MSFIKKSKNSNFDLLSDYSWYVPGVGGIFALLALLLGGALLGNVVTLAMVKLMGADAANTYGMLISYPLMFIPAMIYSKNKSRRNRFMSVTGYAIDSNNFGSIGILLLGAMTIIATISMSFIIDPLNIIMPAMPDWLKELMEKMTNGNFFLNFIMVSIMAPLFEEWLCRGMVLRGLLNYKKIGTDERGIKPAWAIALSALFFAIIHLNPWQAIPAFIMGLLFGYVYYKTGSLKLTMLMHFTNNTLALVLSQFDFGENDALYQVMPIGAYIASIIASIIIMILYLRKVKGIELQNEQGNCDYIEPEGADFID